MLGAIAASRDNVHLRIDLLSRFLPRRWRRLAAALVDLFAAGVSAVLGLVFLAVSWLDSREFGDQVLARCPPGPSRPFCQSPSR